MNIGIIQEELQNILLNLLPRNEYLPASEPFAKISFVEAKVHLHREWIWVTLKGRCVYDTEAPWADYTSYTAVVLEHSWVGLANALPDSPSMKTLSEWALYESSWRNEVDKDETQYAYTHEGSVVVDINVFRNLSIKTAAGVNKDASGDDKWIFETQKIPLKKLKEGASES